MGLDYFICDDNQYCIPPEWICDGKLHCKDGSDEKKDTDRCKEAISQRLKDTGNSSLCVAPYIECESLYKYTTCAKKCDKRIECFDGDDEINPDYNCPKKYKMNEFLTAETTPTRLTSPNFGRGRYKSNERWRRIISADDSYKIDITLQFVDLEPRDDDDDDDDENDDDGGGGGSCFDILMMFEGEKSRIEAQASEMFGLFMRLFERCW